MQRQRNSIEREASNRVAVPAMYDRPTATRGSRDLARVLLISNEVMHYRVSVYNYFYRHFLKAGYELSVLTNKLENHNQKPLEFALSEMPFHFLPYTRAIAATNPAAVILFLHLKDWIIWPLVHWLKLCRIPFAFWTKGGNWDAKPSKARHEMFNYVHGISDALILYGTACKEYIKPRFHYKCFVANNTINYEDYPLIPQGATEIKRELGIPFEKTVLFIGRMDAGNGRKKVDHLVEAFRELDRQDVGLVLVGSGLSDDLKARLNPRNTKYFGPVQDPQDLQISKLCKMADICAIPGHAGLAVNQAFYWGLPVVTEEGDHPPEMLYLKPGRNGFLVPQNDLAGLRTQLLALLDNDALRAELSRNAREDILQNGSIEGMFSGFRDCMDYLTSSAPDRLAVRCEN